MNQTLEPSETRDPVPPMLEQLAAGIRLLVLDVDGVLTDGRIVIDGHGQEIKFFDVKDGYGIRRLLSSQIEVILVTGRQSRSVTVRARDLGVSEVYQGVGEKGAIVKRLIQSRDLRKEEVCVMGDDLPDLAMFEEAGLRIAVADAVPDVLEVADLITRKRGGQGAAREVCDWILQCRKTLHAKNLP